MLALKLDTHMCQAAMTRTGPFLLETRPNGTKVLFFLYLSCFFVLTDGFRFHICFCSTRTRWVWVGGNDENEPKRRVLRHLGPRYIFFNILRVFFVLTINF